MDHWYTDHATLMSFVRVLARAEAFRGDSRREDTRNILYFFEKPWKWTPEYEAWVRLGRPNDVDDVDDLRAGNAAE